MFWKKLVEKKQQIDKLISVSNAIKDLIVRSSWSHCDMYFNSQFQVSWLIVDTNTKYDDLILDIENTINKWIKKMQEEIQKRSNEIFSWNK